MVMWEGVAVASGRDDAENVLLDATKLVSLVRVRLLSGSGFVKGKILELFLIISEKIGRITGEGAKVRRC